MSKCCSVFKPLLILGGATVNSRSRTVRGWNIHNKGFAEASPPTVMAWWPPAFPLSSTWHELSSNSSQLSLFAFFIHRRVVQSRPHHSLFHQTLPLPPPLTFTDLLNPSNTPSSSSDGSYLQVCLAACQNNFFWIRSATYSLPPFHNMSCLCSTTSAVKQFR